MTKREDHEHDTASSAPHSGHAHGVSADADTRYLVTALVPLAAFMVTEVVVGAIGASIWAIRLAARPARGAWTFSWKRAEILSAAGTGSRCSSCPGSSRSKRSGA